MNGTRWLGWLVVITAIYALHQDLWFWREARPLVFGFFPVGLAYHGAYCLAVSVMMWALTRLAWPAHLEVDERLRPGPGSDRGALDAKVGQKGAAGSSTRSGS